MNKSVIILVCLVAVCAVVAAVTFYHPAPTKPVTAPVPVHVSATPVTAPTPVTTPVTAKPASNTLPAPTHHAGTATKTAATLPSTATPGQPPAAPATATPAQPGHHHGQPMAAAGASSSAQRPFGGPGGPGGPGGRRQRPPSFALASLFRNIGQMDEDGKTPLTPAQAKAILAVMTPLRSKPTLKPEEAQNAQKLLEAQLTQTQKDAITALEAQRRS